MLHKRQMGASLANSNTASRDTTAESAQMQQTNKKRKVLLMRHQIIKIQITHELESPAQPKLQLENQKSLKRRTLRILNKSALQQHNRHGKQYYQQEAMKQVNLVHGIER